MLTFFKHFLLSNNPYFIQGRYAPQILAPAEGLLPHACKGSLRSLTKVLLLSLPNKQFRYPLSQKPHPISPIKYPISSILPNPISSLIVCPPQPSILPTQHSQCLNIPLTRKSSSTGNPPNSTLSQPPHHLLSIVPYKVCMPSLKVH